MADSSDFFWRSYLKSISLVKMEKDKKEEQTKPPYIDLDQKQHHITLKVDWQKNKIQIQMALS